MLEFSLYIIVHYSEIYRKLRSFVIMHFGNSFKTIEIVPLKIKKRPWDVVIYFQ